MLNEIKEDQSKIAVVVVGYNRYHGLKRLLDNLNSCNYPDYGVPLIISVDASGNEEVYDLVNNFNWNHGYKIVNIEKQRLGLKKHILQCGSLTRFFKAVILLEDDLYVAPDYYDFAEIMIDYYGKDNRISGISLYEPEINDHVGFPFHPLKNGYDVFAWQRVNTWGQIWTWSMWEPFITWYNQWDEDFSNIDIPIRIKKFKRAWSKYYSAYCAMNKKFFIYPYESLLTNFNDSGGVHSFGDNSIPQVSLLQYKKNYKCGKFEELVKYDIYGQNHEIPSWLSICSDEITIDLYGLNDKYRGRYILCPYKLSYKVICSFGVCMRPLEINIKNKIDGNDIFLYDRGFADATSAPTRHFKYDYISYHLQGFNPKCLLKYLPVFIFRYLKTKILSKLR